MLYSGRSGLDFGLKRMIRTPHPYPTKFIHWPHEDVKNPSILSIYLCITSAFPFDARFLASDTVCVTPVFFQQIWMLRYTPTPLVPNQGFGNQTSFWRRPKYLRFLCCSALGLIQNHSKIFWVVVNKINKVSIESRLSEVVGSLILTRITSAYSFDTWICDRVFFRFPLFECPVHKFNNLLVCFHSTISQVLCC